MASCLLFLKGILEWRMTLFYFKLRIDATDVWLELVLNKHLKMSLGSWQLIEKSTAMRESVDNHLFIFYRPLASLKGSKFRHASCYHFLVDAKRLPRNKELCTAVISRLCDFFSIQPILLSSLLLCDGGLTHLVGYFLSWPGETCKWHSPVRGSIAKVVEVVWVICRVECSDPCFRRPI